MPLFHKRNFQGLICQVALNCGELQARSLNGNVAFVCRIQLLFVTACNNKLRDIVCIFF